MARARLATSHTRRRRIHATSRPKKSLTEHIYDSLRAELLNCELAPGTQIYEGELATRYKVSKTPVREALNSLRQEGLIRVLPRRGYQVTGITLQDILTLLDLRHVLEGGAAALAAERVSATDLARLERLARSSYQRGNRQSKAEFVEANRAFHMRVAELSGNERLVVLIRRCLEELERVFYLGADLRNISDEVAEDHLALVGALRRGDAEAARQIVRTQIAHTKTNILKALTGGSESLQARIALEPPA